LRLEHVLDEFEYRRLGLAFSLLAVIVGGALGCVLRWLFALKFNGLFPSLPLGTLAVNLIGCLIIGVALAWFAKAPGLDPVWRTLITTGFCGGLTTFSSFSAEVITLLQDGKPGWALAAISAHLVGSLLMTALGFALVNGFYRA